MIGAWIAAALLAVSWLLGLGYYQPPNWVAYALVVALGSILLAARPVRLPENRQIAVALLMLIPAVWFMPWPYRTGPLLIVVGLAVQLAPVVRPWPRPLGWGAVRAGVVLLGQSLAMLAYSSHVARSHDLPWPFPSLLGAIASLSGAEVAVHGNTLSIHSAREIHHLAAGWELLLDPATFCFFVGGVILIGLSLGNAVCGAERWLEWLRLVRRLALVTALWLPLRAGLLMSLYLHRALRADPSEPLTVMNQFLSPWVLLLLLAGPVLLAWWFVTVETEENETTPKPGDISSLPLRARVWRYSRAPGSIFLALAIVSFIAQWDPVGRRKDGRVMVVERHSTWEPTDRPYDKQSFGHDPSYSYTKMYDFCSQFYGMSRLEETREINHRTLGECDVLVVKIPTARFSPKEVDAIAEFVKQGGGLLLIGDHTNVFKSSTYLNDVTRRFGFTFRNDLLFSISSPYDQRIDPPLVPHPVVGRLPAMHYAVSCSIDPGRSRGRPVVSSPGLWNLPPEYHAENYHPQAHYRPEMHYGPFIQLWAARHGSGRVLAFTDSTIFSNFSIFQPGKAELMVGMLQWLNHTSVLDRGWVRASMTILLSLIAIFSLAGGLLLAQARGICWLTLLAAGVLGVTAGCWIAVSAHRLAMPEPKNQRPATSVTIDRTVSDVPLSLGAFSEVDNGRGYGLFEQWIPRLGYVTRRGGGLEAFSGDALAVICPTRSVTREFRVGLRRYVAEGGRLLVIDSPDSVASTANSLLWQFGMVVDHATSRSGRLRLSDDGWPDLQVEATCEIIGGEPFMWIGQTPVAARTVHGNGSVMAIGFGSLLNDTGMGEFWTVEPDTELLTRFDVLFTLLESLVEDRPMTTPPPRQADSAESSPSSGF